MGLALHHPPDDSIFQAKHFPPEPPRAIRYRRKNASHNHLLRAALAQQSQAGCGDDTALHTRKADLVYHHQRKAALALDRRPRAFHFVSGVNDTDEDIIRLARSTAALPSDGSRNRVPSLERQNAFRDASTAKAPPVRSLSQGCEVEDPEVAELYRLGLLYDDEHVRGSGFNFNAIVHDEPSYTLKPRRRSSRGRARRSRGADDDDALKLPMDWTLSGLGDDDEVARYLVDESSRATDNTDGPSYSRRGYRMIWRSAPPVQAPHDSTSGDASAASGGDPSTSVSSLHRSAYSDISYVCDDDDDDDNSDDDEMDWAVLSPGAYGARETATVDAATGTWVVLGDGS